MDVKDTACFRLAMHGKIPGFGKAEAGVLSRILKYRRINLCSLHYLTGIETGRLREILQGFENAGIVEIQGATYIAKDAGEALCTLIEISEAWSNEEEEKDEGAEEKAGKGGCKKAEICMTGC